MSVWVNGQERLVRTDKSVLAFFSLSMSVFRILATTRVDSGLPTSNIQGAREGTAATRDVEDFNLDAFLRKRLAKRRWCGEAEFLP